MILSIAPLLRPSSTHSHFIPYTKAGCGPFCVAVSECFHGTQMDVIVIFST